MTDIHTDSKQLRDLGYIAMVVVSAFIYSLGMNIFVKSGNLFPGGYAGISRLAAMALSDFTGISISFSIIYFALNIATAIFIWKKLGHKFVARSVLWFSLTSVFTAILPQPQITQDALLISVFGGLINGLAVGIALRAHASSGGTDFIAMDISARTNRSSWNYILCVNAVVLVIAGLRYGWNQSLYSIIFQYVSTQVVNSLHQKYKMTSIHIITDHADAVAKAVFDTVRHGITGIHCEGVYSHSEHTMLMVTVGNDQVKEVVHSILDADPHAFITENHVERIVGNYYQKPID